MRHLILLAACAALIPATSAQAQRQTLRLPDVMTRDEMDAIGVDSLSAPRRAALERLLDRITRSRAMREISPATVRPGRGTSGTTLTLRRVGDRGEAIILEDGSVWKVELSHRAVAASWRSGQHILIRHRTGASGTAAFELENAQAGSRVAARFAGTLEPPAPPPPARTPPDDPRAPALWRT